MSDPMDTDDSKSDSLPWVEKYRPKTTDDLISHQDIISTLNRFIETNQLPHLLFYGPPGTGKTSTILAMARMMHGQAFSQLTLELNASDDRNISVVRDKIKRFASTQQMFSTGIKLIVLDEADAMTKEAQAALRRVMEKYTKNTRFCLICNQVNRIIPAIQSRCTKFRFSPLLEDQARLRLDHIIATEGVKIDEDGMKALLRLGRGDMRRSINILQSTNMSFGEVNGDNVYLCTGNPHPNHIRTLVTSCFNDSFTDAYANALNLTRDHGFALSDIITDAAELIRKMKLADKTKGTIYMKLGEIEYRLSLGSTEKFQMGAFVAALQLAKNEIASIH